MKYLKNKPGIICGTAILLCALLAGSALAFDHQRQAADPLAFLKKALIEAGAASLTTDQESQINALLTAYKAALPNTVNQALLNARTAFNTAILAGNLAEAQKQAGIISGLVAGDDNARLLAEAKLGTDVRTILKNGGQYDALALKFSSERLVGLLTSHGDFGRGGR